MDFGDVVDDLLDHHFRLLSQFLVAADQEDTLRVRGGFVAEVNTGAAVRLNLGSV